MKDVNGDTFTIHDRVAVAFRVGNRCKIRTGRVNVIIVKDPTVYASPVQGLKIIWDDTGQLSPELHYESGRYAKI